MPRNGGFILGPLRRRVDEAAGGPARGRVVLTLAAVLAVDAADKGTVGATATNLEDAFSIGTVEIGLLFTVTSVVGAAATLPFGVLVDRVERTRLLTIVLLAWTVAMLAGAAAQSYAWLLASRVLLGVVAAAAYPAVASLVGDWFLVGERGRILGLILAGELVGTGLGIAVAGAVAGAVSWRAAFALLAVPSLVVAALVHLLPEPARGGASRMAPGQDAIVSAQAVEWGTAPPPPDESGRRSRAASLAALVRKRGIRPARREAPPDLERLPLWSAVRYVLGVRTNLVLIASSALGYYFFAGVRAFGVEYADEQYGVVQELASVLVLVLGSGALVGVVVGGRFADRLLLRGHLSARIVVPAVAFVAAAVAFVPAVITTALAVAFPLLMLAGFFLAVANPPLDAARLDVMPARLWDARRARGASCGSGSKRSRRWRSAPSPPTRSAVGPGAVSRAPSS
jgi:predicted MFS family arabinose efflux permease